MAKSEEKKADEKKSEPLYPSITAKNDTLAECNRQAQELRAPRVVRERTVLKRINDFVKQELKRA
jgi:hypothetical protein